MNKRIIFMLLASVAIAGCAKDKKAPSKEATILSKGMKFCEGSVAYGSSVLVTNFGTSELNPLNTQGMGYVMQINGDSTETFIATDGHLSAPKGMAIANNHLYIADVGKIVVYNLKDKAASPQTIVMPEGNLFVNDIVISGSSAYVSVTNTGKIFKLDLSTPDALNANMLSEYASVPGANGLVLIGNQLYIASYPADGKTTSDNVIYTIADIASPVVEKFITRQGQYDGLAHYKNKLYFSSWINGEIGSVDLATKEVKLMEVKGVELSGPADITILNDVLYIPNLPSSEVAVIALQ